MYSYLHGRVVAKAEQHIVLDVHDIGYKIFIPSRMLKHLSIGDETTIHTYLQVREDEMSLYGFIEPETLALFELLLTVTGVGPKLALSIVSGTTCTAFCQAVLTNNLPVLTQIPGVGKKTAQRLVLELKDKIAQQAPLPAAETEAAPVVDNSVNAQVLAALTALGYKPDEAEGALRSALQQLSEPGGVESLLRESLKYLGSHGR